MNVIRSEDINQKLENELETIKTIHEEEKREYLKRISVTQAVSA